jgi:hypothetical protein
MIRIIATTINSSIREKPLELFFIQSSSGKTKLPLGNFQVNGTPERLLSQSPAPNPWIRRWSGRDKCFRHCLGDAPGLARRLAKYLRSSRSTLTPTTTSQSEVAAGDASTLRNRVAQGRDLQSQNLQFNRCLTLCDPDVATLNSFWGLTVGLLSKEEPSTR